MKNIIINTEENKKNSTKKAGKFVAMFAAAMAITTFVSIGASAAELPQNLTTDANTIQTTANATVTSSDVFDIVNSRSFENDSDSTDPLIRQRYERNLRQFHNLQDMTSNVKISNQGLYHAKSSKLYGKRIVDVDKKTGEFILSDWECISNFSLDGYKDVSFKISSTYVAFAYSYDITWGTNFPYSGIFFNDINNIFGDDINITLTGCVRNAGITIKVGQKTVVDEINCSSHSEFKPV